MAADLCIDSETVKELEQAAVRLHKHNKHLGGRGAAAAYEQVSHAQCNGGRSSCVQAAAVLRYQMRGQQVVTT